MVVFGSVLTASTTADTVLSRKLRVQPRATIDETTRRATRRFDYGFIFRNKLDRPHVVIAATRTSATQHSALTAVRLSLSLFCVGMAGQLLYDGLGAWRLHTLL